MKRIVMYIVSKKLFFIVSSILVFHICCTMTSIFGAEQEKKTKNTGEAVASSPEATINKARKDGKCTEGNCENGKGTMIYPDGTKYTGEFKNGRRDGYGTYTYSDGGNYTGEWKDNVRHGKGTDIYSNGIKYEGEWQFDKRHGQGTLMMPDLGTYTGAWKEGKKHGYGTFSLVDGGRYEGEWVDGACEGHGTQIFANGNKYVGEWEGFAATGGWYYWPDGSRTWSYMDENLKWVHKFSKPRKSDN